LTQVREKLEKKEKILKMIYKNALMNVQQNAEKDPFFR